MKDLIAKCIYYKGEDECPEIIVEKQMSNIWYYEKLWVESENFRNENSDDVIHYIEIGLKDFNESDGIPLTLKAMLFNRHSHWCGGWGIETDITNFKEWYLSTYNIK